MANRTKARNTATMMPPGGPILPELAGIQLFNQTGVATRGKQVQHDPRGGQRGAKPEREPIRLRRGAMLRDLKLLQKESKAGHHEAKTHRCQTGANPRKQGSLRREKIAQIWP